eukprot:6281040-Amphidinium_carterae.1
MWEPAWDETADDDWWWQAQASEGRTWQQSGEAVGDSVVTEEQEATSAVVTEEEAQEIYAQMQYSQARQAMLRDRLQRGYGSGFPTFKGKGKGYDGKGKKGKMGKNSGKAKSMTGYAGSSGKGGKTRLQALIGRTRCNFCGDVGHWQRDCPKKAATSSTAAASSSSTSAARAGPPRSFASFFICDGAKQHASDSFMVAAIASSKGSSICCASTEYMTGNEYLTSSLDMTSEYMTGNEYLTGSLDMDMTSEHMTGNEHRTSSLDMTNVYMKGNVYATDTEYMTDNEHMTDLDLNAEKKNHRVVVVNTVLASFIGLVCQAGMALIDTGAQSCVIGKQAFADLRAALKERGLQPMQMEVEHVHQTRGIGGQATVLSLQQVPIGVCGVPGLLNMQVLDQDIPLLLHIGLLKGLGLQLDLSSMRCKWKNLGGRSSQLQEQASGHLLISVLDFKAWHPPPMLLLSELSHDEFVTVYGSMGSESESSNSFTSLTAKADVGPIRSTTSRSDPSSKAVADPQDQTVVFCPGGVTMDATELEAGVVDQRSLAAQATHQVDPCQDSREHGARGDSFSPCGRLEEYQSSCNCSAVTSDQWSSCGGRVIGQQGQIWQRGPNSVRTSKSSVEGKSQCQSQVVDLPGVRHEVSKVPVAGSATACPGEDGPGSTLRLQLRGDSRRLRPMGSSRVRGQWRLHASSVAALLFVAHCTRASGIGSTSNFTCGTVEGSSTNLCDVPASAPTATFTGNTTDPAARGSPGARVASVAGRRDDLLRQRSGGRVHSCTPLAADLQLLRQELDQTVLPAHHARRYATGLSRGVLLGLYTKQGGCGLTAATKKYEKLRKIVLKVARQLRVDFTSVQINVFEGGDETDPTTL